MASSPGCRFCTVLLVVAATLPHLAARADNYTPQCDSTFYDTFSDAAFYGGDLTLPAGCDLTLTNELAPVSATLRIHGNGGTIRRSSTDARQLRFVTVGSTGSLTID